jgi:transcription antitermination factor NusG
MGFYEQVNVEEKTSGERIFDLECQVSMLQEFIIQLTTELKGLGISVSDKLNDHLVKKYDRVRILKGNFEGSVGEVLNVNKTDKIAYIEVEDSTLVSVDYEDVEVL